MYTPLPEDSETRLNDLVSKALGENFASGVAEKVNSLVGEIQENLHYAIQDQLEGELQSSIIDEARRAAERFLERLRAGDENAVRHFLKLPSGYLPHMEERNCENGLLNVASEYGGIALRQKLLEAIQPRLEAERIKDLEAESGARLKALHRERLSGREIRQKLADVEAQESMLRSQVERLERQIADLTPGEEAA